ncbi:hypothetical protein A4A49_05705 [Nicotiana attenuata]|uniref:Uncharacterized protein n=1 Tax=Nicotiana attenuata TaxID=49451 RepID=A0A1J6I5V0_NICAT|nr:hypothetical protein A4A49_05705 [Nicotiana attenuata]
MADRATSTLQDDEAYVEPSELPEKHIDVDSLYDVADGSHIEVEILKERQAGNELMTKKEEFSEEGQGGSKKGLRISLAAFASDVVGITYLPYKYSRSNARTKLELLELQLVAVAEISTVSYSHDEIVLKVDRRSLKHQSGTSSFEDMYSLHFLMALGSRVELFDRTIARGYSLENDVVDNFGQLPTVAPNGHFMVVMHKNLNFDGCWSQLLTGHPRILCPQHQLGLAQCLEKQFWLHQFSPDELGLDFPFDPGSAALIRVQSPWRSWLDNGRRILDDKRDTVLGSSIPPTTVYCASHEMLLGAFESVRSSQLALALSLADGKPSIRRGAIRHLCFAYVSASNEHIFGSSTLMLRVVVTASTARFLELICGCSCNRKFAPHTIIAWIHQNGSTLEKPLDCLLPFDLEDPYVGQHRRSNITPKASKIIATTTTMLQGRIGDWITLALGPQISTKLVLLKDCYILLGFVSQADDGGDPHVIGVDTHLFMTQELTVTIVVPGMSRAWDSDLNSAQDVGACHPVNFTSIEVNIIRASLTKYLIPRILDPNLEDKVLIEEGSIVVNMDNSNNAFGPIIWNEASQAIGPRDKLQKGQGIRQPNKRFAWDTG